MRELQRLVFSILLSAIPRMLIATITVYSFSVVVEGGGYVITWPLNLCFMLLFVWAIKPTLLSILELLNKLN